MAELNQSDDMDKQPELKIIDGRRQRSERSRTAIITASLNLIDEGNYAPTAKQIAEEAGIGLRSFFRHFDDMEALMDALDGYMRGFYEPLFARPCHGGALQERIEEIVTDRTDAYERLKKIMMTTQAQLWRSQAVQKNYARNQTGLRRHLEHWLPEIKQLPKANCEAVHAAASFETWHRLRIHQKLNISDARDSVTAMLTKLMD